MGARPEDAKFSYVKDPRFLPSFLNGCFLNAGLRLYGCPWDKLTFEGNKTAYEYYADWANSRDFPRQPKSLVVDSRGPNGDGDLTFSECSPFP